MGEKAVELMTSLCLASEDARWDIRYSWMNNDLYNLLSFVRITRSKTKIQLLFMVTKCFIA